MCGIVGYVGPDEALPIVLEGLRRLEYRGYDSAGVAVLDGGRKIIVSNDSDFGISDSTGDAAPFGLVAKTRPDGSVDDGRFLVIDRH